MSGKRRRLSARSHALIYRYTHTFCEWANRDDGEWEASPMWLADNRDRCPQLTPHARSRRDGTRA